MQAASGRPGNLTAASDLNRDGEKTGLIASELGNWDLEVSSDDAAADGVQDDFHGAVDVDLFHDPGTVRLHRAQADAQ